MSLAPYRERANAASTLCSARNLSSCFSGAICEQDRCGREGQAWVSRSHRRGEDTVGKSGCRARWGIQV